MDWSFSNILDPHKVDLGGGEYAEFYPNWWVWGPRPSQLPDAVVLIPYVAPRDYVELETVFAHILLRYQRQDVEGYAIWWGNIKNADEILAP